MRRAITREQAEEFVKEIQSRGCLKTDGAILTKKGGLEQRPSALAERRLNRLAKKLGK